MKIKVSRQRLIDSLNKSIERLEREHEKQLEKYCAAAIKAKTKILRNLSAFTDELGKEDAGIPGEYEIGRRLLKGIDHVSEPKKPETEITHIRALLRKLDLAHDEEILVSDSEPYFKYV